MDDRLDCLPFLMLEELYQENCRIGRQVVQKNKGATFLSTVANPPNSNLSSKGRAWMAHLCVKASIS